MNLKTRYSAKELQSMKLKSLDEVGKPLGLVFNKNHPRKKRAEMILAAYNQAETSAQDVADAPTGQPQQTESAEPILHEQKPEFENLCNGSAGGDPVEHVEPENRGGVRAGAGRPVGMTGEIALYNSLPQQPHPAIKAMFEMAFREWSNRADCPEIALTEEQAIEVALPWTQVAHVLGVTDVIPPWLLLGLTCLWTTANLFSAKAKIAREAVTRRRAAESEIGIPTV